MYLNDCIAVIFLDNVYERILLFRKEEAMNRPKLEFVPKTLADLHVEGGLSDHMNGGNFSLHGKTHFTDTPHTARWHSGGLAVSNCSLFSLYFCYAGVYVSLRGSTLTDIYILHLSLIFLPLRRNHPISNLLYALFSRTNCTICACQN